MAGEARKILPFPISLLGLASSLKDLAFLIPLIEEPPHQTDRFELFLSIPTFGIIGLSVDPAPEDTPLVDDPAGDGRLATVEDADGSASTSFANGPT